MVPESGLRSAVRRQVPIRWLLVGAYVVLFVACVSLLGLMLYWRLALYITRLAETRLMTEVVASLSRAQEGAGDQEEWVARDHLPAPPAFPQGATELARDLGTRVTPSLVLGADGRVLAFHPRLPRGLEPDPARIGELGEKVRQTGGRARLFYLTTEGKRPWQVLLVPLYRDNEVVGYIQVASSWRPFRMLIQQLGLYLLVGVAFTGLLGMMAISWISRVLVTPLERLAATSRRVAGGDLEARTGLAEGSNEIHVVAREFDHMVAQVQAAFAAQRRFVADASHELKTPLTAIGGMAEVLSMGADQGDADKRRLALATISKEVDRMNRLVGDLLTLCRTQQAPQGERVLVDMGEVLEEASQAPPLVSRTHRIQVSREGDLRVMGDRDALARVVRNLVENAVKYSPDGGAVRLEGLRSAAGVEVRVGDDGPGIDPAKLALVFEPFYRADASRDRKTGGSGLGLAIVKAIVESHGGAVNLDSAPGRGTTARVLLPPATRGDGGGGAFFTRS